MSALVVKVALPAPSRVPVPSVVAPSVKVTVPAGVPEPDATCAVNVTDCPKTAGLLEAESVVVVAAPSAA